MNELRWFCNCGFCMNKWMEKMNQKKILFRIYSVYKWFEMFVWEKKRLLQTLTQKNDNDNKGGDTDAKWETQG